MATLPETTPYEAALEYLYGRINYERATIPAYRVQNFKLDRMRDLLARLGNPQRALKIIHIAGTKGKGSTSSMLAAILTAAGVRTGMYTSPHLERTEERLVVDGVICAPSELVALVEAVRPAIDSIDAEAALCTGPGSPTYFEMMTAMALVHFARQKVDAVVLEVGLGGRLDSTNVVSPEVCAITSISFDHMKQLGNTLGAIAGEKAGIIKPQVPVVTGVGEAEPLAVIESVAERQNARLYRVGRDFSYTFTPSVEADPLDKLPRGRLEYRGAIEGAETCHKDLSLGLIGEHQGANAAVAIALVERLRERGWKISDEAIRAGLKSVRCPARIEVLRTSPTVVIDTAHNPASIAALLKVLTAARGFKRRHLVFACSRDKEPAGMLEQLWPHFEHVVLTRFLNNPRSLSPEELAGLAPQGRSWPRVDTCENPLAAWRMVQGAAQRDDLICVTGSFFLAAELRSVILAS